MPAQPVIFLLLFGGVQGLLFILFLLHKKLYQSGYVFLLLYLGVMLLQLTLKVMNKLWLMDNFSFTYRMAHYFPLLYGPLVYLFVIHMPAQKDSRRRSVVHFLPFVGMMLLIALDNYGTLPVTVTQIVFNPVMRSALLLTSLALYHLLAFQICQRCQSSAADQLTNMNVSQLNWLKKFIIVSSIICSTIAIALYLLYINYPSGHEYRYGFAVLTIFMYWISYTALKQPVIFSVIKGHAADTEHHIPALTIHRPVKKYSSSTLHAKDKMRICTALDNVMKNDKLYLDAALNIDSLADKVGCSRHALSQVLNECMQQSFYEYINEYRVQAAKALLADECRKEHKVAAIAYDAGFNSLSAFNDVFKKIAGCTPSQFRKYPETYSHRQRV